MKIIIICFLVCFAIFPFFRCFISNLYNVGIYSCKDLYYFIKEHKWNDFNFYGIDMFIGMFGHGKTLSMTHKARILYKIYGNDIRFFSNYELKGIPYIPLINFNQLVDIGEEETNSYKGTVVLIDEIENVLSHRNFAKFPLELLHMLTQQRKKRVYIMCSAQRFFMVDKLFRAITTNVFDCYKVWRFQNTRVYDAWDYENAMNPQLIKRIGNFWWFVRDKDFASYDTSEMVKKGMAEDFISNEEAIIRKGLDAVSNEVAVHKPSKTLKKVRRKRK